MDFDPLPLLEFCSTNPKIYSILDSLLDDYEKLSRKHLRDRTTNLRAQAKYSKTDKGKERRRIASRNYYQRKKAERQLQNNLSV